jgi:hypothetical protein
VSPAPKRDRGAPRRTTRDAQKYELLVFVEGKTEESHLAEWHRRHREKVNVTVSEFTGPPLKLVKRAVQVRAEEERAASRQQGRAHNEYWCVFDVDEHHGLPEAISLARDHDINIALSHPNIELWFILHFEDRTAPTHRHDATARAQELLKCGKNLTPDAAQQLVARYAAAAERAQKLDAKHEGDGSPPGSNPSSGVWRLVEIIRDPPPRGTPASV